MMEKGVSNYVDTHQDLHHYMAKLSSFKQKTDNLLAN